MISTNDCNLDHILMHVHVTPIILRVCIISFYAGYAHQAEVDIVLGGKQSELLERTLLRVKTIEILCHGAHEA